MMPTDFDKVLAPFLAPRDIPPTTPETSPLGRLGQVRPPRHVAEALPFLGMSLDEFGHRDAWLELMVPWLTVTLWIVPGEPDVTALLGDGISRGRIWTASELMNLLQIVERSQGTIETLTHAKLVMDGDIIEVRPRPTPESDQEMRL